MSDDFEKFYEDKESNEDSRSDARVALILVICFVAEALFWVSGQYFTQIETSQHLKLPYIQSLQK